MATTDALFLHQIESAPLVFLRVATALKFLPFFNGNAIPILPWLALSTVTTMAMLPTGHPISEHTLLPYLTLGLKEVFVGLTIGILVQMAFAVLEMTAGLARSAGGPINGNSEFDPLLQLYTLTGVAVLFVVDGHHHLFFGMKHTFDVFPVDQMLPISSGNMLSPEPFIRLFSMAFLTAVFASTPVFFAGYISDLFVGGLSHLFKQAPVMGVQIFRKIAVWTVAVFTLGMVINQTLLLLKSAVDRLVTP